jgi:hypothetical protein
VKGRCSKLKLSDGNKQLRLHSLPMSNLLPICASVALGVGNKPHSNGGLCGYRQASSIAVCSKQQT